MFTCEFWEIFKDTSFTEHLWANASEMWKMDWDRLMTHIPKNLNRSS